jgi:hypothetical protein
MDTCLRLLFHIKGAIHFPSWLDRREFPAMGPQRRFNGFSLPQFRPYRRPLYIEVNRTADEQNNRVFSEDPESPRWPEDNFLNMDFCGEYLRDYALINRLAGSVGLPPPDDPLAKGLMSALYLVSPPVCRKGLLAAPA